MSRRLILFAGPGRAGTTFVQKLLVHNQNVHNAFLPIIKEPYLINYDLLTEEDLRMFYGSCDSGTYVDLSNLSYQVLEPRMDKLRKVFDDIVVVIMYRNSRDWIKSLLLFEVRKGEILSSDLFLNKAREIDLKRYVNSSDFHVLEFRHIEDRNEQSLTSLLTAVFNCPNSWKIDFEIVNQSIQPRLLVFGKLARYVVRVLRRFGFYRFIEVVKRSKIRWLFFKIPNSAINEQVDDLIKKHSDVVEEIDVANREVCSRF